MGCNGFGGEYSADGKTITFGPIMSTMMACEEPIMSQESTALQVMIGTTPFEIAGDTLTIHSADGNSVLILKRK
jgi:putative lipoprotein